MTNEALQTILKKHKMWLKNEVGGERANLQGANLQNANLRNANLYNANLRYANLRNADLQDANLRYAILQGADLQYVYLQDADLRNAILQGADLRNAILQGANLQNANLRNARLYNADLQGADLQGADLRYANLQDANLQDAKNIPERVKKQLNNLPKGKLIGYKKCQNDVIVTLEIPAKARRSKSTTNKCRAEYAKVVAISDGATEARSTYVAGFKYVVGKTVKPDSWDNNWNNECSNGIHFFLTMKEARNY